MEEGRNVAKKGDVTGDEGMLEDVGDAGKGNV